MTNIVSINRRIELATECLLRQHQAIIDAWYAKWIKQEHERIDAAFRKGSAAPNGER